MRFNQGDRVKPTPEYLRLETENVQLKHNQRAWKWFGIAFFLANALTVAWLITAMRRIP